MDSLLGHGCEKSQHPSLRLQTDSCDGIFVQSMGARNRVLIGLSYRPARLHRLAKLIPESEFFFNLRSPRIDSKEPIPMLPGGPVRQPYSYSVPSPHRRFKNSSTVLKFGSVFSLGSSPGRPLWRSRVRRGGWGWGGGWSRGSGCTRRSPAPPRTLKFYIYIFLGDFFSYYIQHCFICRPSDSTVPADAGIEPRTVATSLVVRRL